MEKFVPFDKMSKKGQKKLNDSKRRDWNGLDPVTRVAPDAKKAYKRKPKHPNRIEECYGGKMNLPFTVTQAELSDVLLNLSPIRPVFILRRRLSCSRRTLFPQNTEPFQLRCNINSRSEL